MDVELDGHHHKQVDQIENDTERTELLKEFGITVIRFWKDEVIDEIEKVLEKIAEYLV